jgi:hypothetical protein
MDISLDRKLNNYPRVLVVGRSGTAKEHFCSRMSQLCDWEHINLDEKINNGLEDIRTEIPQRNFCIVNWSISTKYLPFLTEMSLNRGYSILRFTASEEAIEKQLLKQGLSKEYIKDSERIDDEEYALSLIDILSNVSVVMNAEHFDKNNNYKPDTFIYDFDDYYRKNFLNL